MMNWLLHRIGLPKAIGLYIEDQAIHISQVVAAPLGPVQLCHLREDISSATTPAEVITRMLGNLPGQGRLHNVPIAVGISEGKTYFSTRPTQPGVVDPAPRVLLREALQSAHVRVEEMMVDVVHAQPDKRHVASIACCERAYLQEIIQPLKASGSRDYRAEPAPTALLRAASLDHPSRRGDHVTLRVFLSQTRCLAALTVKNMPIAWRRNDLPRGDEAAALLSAVRSLIAVSRHSGIESKLDRVMVHGRHELSRLVDVDWLQNETSAAVEWFNGPPLEAESIAFGLATGCLQNNKTTFDLAKPLKQAASLWDLFPWRLMASQAAVLLCMALLLIYRVRSLDASLIEIQTQNARHVTACEDTKNLQREKKTLRQEVSSVSSFLDRRISWSGYMRDLAASLPDNVFLTSFQGVSELKTLGKKKSSVRPNMSLVLRGAVSIPQSGVTPLEIDSLLETLRAHPVFPRDFPTIELAGLKHYQSSEEADNLAMFTIMFLPNGSKQKRPS